MGCTVCGAGGAAVAPPAWFLAKLASSETTLMPRPTLASANSRIFDTREVNCGAELSFFSPDGFPAGGGLPFTGAAPGAGFVSACTGLGIFFAAKFTLHTYGSSRHKSAADIRCNRNQNICCNCNLRDSHRHEPGGSLPQQSWWRCGTDFRGFGLK